MRNFKPLAILCGCTARFLSDLAGNPEDRFSHNEAHFISAVSIFTSIGYYYEKRTPTMYDFMKKQVGDKVGLRDFDLFCFTQSHALK